VNYVGRHHELTGAHSCCRAKTPFKPCSADTGSAVEHFTPFANDPYTGNSIKLRDYEWRPVVKPLRKDEL
jgi:hypothetical protein